MRKILMMAAFVAVFSLQAKAQNVEPDLDAQYATELIKPGRVAPDFELKTIDGKPFVLSMLKGKTIVLDFWASWCPDCRKDAPEVMRLYREFHSPDVVFVGVSMDTNVEQWRAAVAHYGIEYTQVSELKKFKETDIARLYGVKWIPSMVVIDPNGKVLLSTVQFQKVEKLLRQR